MPPHWHTRWEAMPFRHYRREPISCPRAAPLAPGIERGLDGGAQRLSNSRGDRGRKYGMFRVRRRGGMGVDTTEHSTCVGQFGIGAAEEVQAWICVHDGHPFIELHLHQHAAPGETPPS